MQKLTMEVSIKDTEEFKNVLNVLEQSAIALTRIAEWNELSVEQRCDIGSNGQRDYYRRIAIDALDSIKNLGSKNTK